jgi:alpha-2-macroglobulin
MGVPVTAQSGREFVLRWGPRAWSVAGGLTLVMVAASLSCGSPRQPTDLHVLSYSPTGEQASAAPIEVRFDKPVIEESEVGKPAATDSLTLAPPVPWKGYWQDRQTLVVEPQAPLAESTEYAVKLGGWLQARTGGFGFSFTHRPLAVEGVWGVELTSIAPDGELPITFNQAVRAADVLAHCALTAAGETKPTALALGGATQLGKTIGLRPQQPLHPGGDYQLRCDGLHGAAGNATLASAYLLDLKVRPELTVVSAEPQGDSVDADSVELTVSFSTAVELETARKAITSTPSIPGLAQGWLSDQDTVYHATVDLAATTSYALRVNALVDRFGQKLTQPFTHTFKSGTPRPRISMERGIFALEASAAGYPVWSRNVDHYSVECAAIPRDKVVQILTTDMNYDPWGGNDDDKPIAWGKLNLTAKKKDLDFKNAADQWKLTNVDLGATCGAGAGKRGVYLAEVQSDQVQRDDNRPWMTVRRNRVLANVTDLGVLLKVGTSSGLVWVTSLATGAPVAGAKVTVYTPEGKSVFSGTSDRDGLAMIPGSAVLKAQPSANNAGTNNEGDPEGEGDWDSYRSQRVFALVEKDADTAVVDGNWANGIQIWNFGFPEERRGGKVVLRGFIQSDRGLYRPGESVHFKGLIREITSGRPPRVPARRAPVAISVEDSRGQVVHTGTAAMSPFGGFSFDLQLSTEATVGDYYVSATVAGQLFRERFSVEEFRAATFEVKATSASKDVRPGDRLSFAVDASYLFGAPVADAKVEWSVRRRAHRLRFAGYDEFTFSASPTDFWWYEPEDDYGEMITDGEGATDAHGRLEIATRDGATDLKGPQDYILSASVTDSSDQTMGKSLMIEAHQSSMYLGMHTQEYVQAVGMPFGVNLVALRPDGSRVGATAKLSFIKTVQSCTWQDQGLRSYSTCEGSEKVMIERNVTINAAGSTVERIYPTEPGDYLVKLEGKDDRGQPLLTTSSLWVIGKGEAFWSGDESARMGLIASRPSYHVGDTARLVPQANLKKPTALITIERDGIIEARVRKMESPAQGLELTIADGWAPNVFASVAMVSGRQGAGDRNRPQFKMGMVELKVATDRKELKVDIELEHDKVKPGEPVAGVVRVTQDGKPVVAEVAVSAADEGILQLIAFQTPNPLKTFYATWGLGVDSGTNLNRLARLADPKAGDPDEGGDSKAKDGQRVRSRFVSSAYWAPALVTDANGQARFSFVAPDNLTAFRVMAVAADMTDRFGAGERRFTIAKPLMAQPVLPRFLRSDDVASIGVLVHNHTVQAGTATVTAEATGLALDRTSATVAVPAGGSARVRFVAKTSERAEAALSFAVTMGTEKDAVAVTLPIAKPRISEARTLMAQRLDGGAAWTGQLTRAASSLPKESELAITIDRTGLGDLAPSLRYLVQYPYGCLEQTLSKTVPLIAAKELTGALGNPELQPGRVEALLRAGVAKVIRHQQGDGLFSLWPQSNTYPHLTALALWGLGEAKRAGLDVPDEVFANGLNALLAWAKKPGVIALNGDGATLAMTALLLAERGRADTGLNARLYELRGDLPHWGQAFLLRALAASKAPRVQVNEMKALLTSGVEVKDGKALLHERGGNESYYLNSDVRASAMGLIALLEVDPSDSMVAPLAAGLKAARNAAGHWRNTEDNLWGLVALARYASAVGPGRSTATLSVAGKVLAKKTVSGGETAVMRLALADVPAGELKVAVDGAGFVTARVTEVSKDAGGATDHGFTVRREVLDLNGKPITKVSAGSLVNVKVFVESAKERNWVAVIDPIPAGFEVVNPKLAAGASTAPGETEHRDWWQEIVWDNQELRDDHVQWFADKMPAGHYVLSYQARATTDGTFLVLPAHAEAMYEPEINGRSASSTFVVTP